MNTMSGKCIILLILIVVLHNQNYAKVTVPDSTFRFMIELSGGYTASLDSTINKGGITPCIRIMWEPDHKLNIGIETSYMLIEKHSLDEQNYDAGKTSMDVSLKAIPILLVFNIEAWKMDFCAAMGTSYVWTELDAYNEKVYSPVWNYSLMFGWGYTLMFTDNFGIGLEAKTYVFTTLNKYVGSLQMKLKYCILEW